MAFPQPSGPGFPHSQVGYNLDIELSFTLDTLSLIVTHFLPP